MTARPLFILGTSGLAWEVAQLVSQVDPLGERWDLRGFIAASATDVGRHVGKHPVLGDDEWLLKSELEADVVVGIGHPQVRQSLTRAYRDASPRLSFPNLVHPRAIVDPAEVEMGQGNAITAGCILTVGIRLGDFNLINWNTTVGHGVRIGDCTVINPTVSISGDVVLGDGVLVGTGAQILEGRTVGSGARVGAGAVVTADVADGTTVVGMPAKPLAARSSGAG